MTIILKTDEQPSVKTLREQDLVCTSESPLHTDLHLITCIAKLLMPFSGNNAGNQDLYLVAFVNKAAVRFDLTLVLNSMLKFYLICLSLLIFPISTSFPETSQNQKMTGNSLRVFRCQIKRTTETYKIYTKFKYHACISK